MNGGITGALGGDEECIVLFYFYDTDILMMTIGRIL
jgi:hypothetical protein